MFDWLTFFNKYNIDYTRKGHTTNNVGINCPFCNDSKDKQYLGVSLTGKGWSCWKFQKAHGGVSPYRLIIALIGCSYTEAVKIVQDDERVVHKTTEDRFLSDFHRLLGVNKPSVPVYEPPTSLGFLNEFKPLDATSMSRRLVYPYLNRRGYTDDRQIDWLADHYRLRFAYNGVFAYRIIIPVYMHGELITWTGRTISDDEDLRYDTLSPDPVKAINRSVPCAMLSIKDTIFDYDNLLDGGDTLAVTEGPFDAMRITFLGKRYGILGTCLYNKTLAPVQASLLGDLTDKFNKYFNLFDEGESLTGFQTFPYSLRYFERLSLPRGYKDPATLDENGFNYLFGFTG
jgi:hypothetical protein